VAGRKADTAFESGAKKRPTGPIARVWGSSVGLCVTTVEQSGVALCFPPHSKVAVLILECGGRAKRRHR
jgi:hypothetical protein